MLSTAKPHILLGLLITACSRQEPAPAPAAPPAHVPRVEEPNAVAKGSGAEEISYRATGTEPFWGLSVTQRELRMTWPEPEPSVTTSYVLEERADGRTYKGVALTATVTFKACSDGMSDRSYPHTVKVEMAGRVWKGCGWPAGYDLGPPP